MDKVFVSENHPDYPDTFHERVLAYEQSCRSDQKAVVMLNAEVAAKQSALERAEEECRRAEEARKCAEEAQKRAEEEIAKLRAALNANITT